MESGGSGGKRGKGQRGRTGRAISNDGTRRIRRLVAAFEEANRRKRTDEIVHVSLRLLRAWKEHDDYRTTRSLATRHALTLIEVAPRNPAVRRFWGPRAPGRDLVPLLRAQTAMFAGRERRSPPRGRAATKGSGRPLANAARGRLAADYVVLGLVLSRLSYISDVRALSCVCKDARDAVAHGGSGLRVRRSTPLCWFDVTASYRLGLRVLLPGGGSLCARTVGDEAASGACVVDMHTDVFECMLRGYAAGAAGAELVANGLDARDFDSARDDVSAWLSAFGCFLAQRRLSVCYRLLFVQPNKSLFDEGRRVLRAVC